MPTRRRKQKGRAEVERARTTVIVDTTYIDIRINLRSHRIEYEMQ